MYRVTSVT